MKKLLSMLSPRLKVAYDFKRGLASAQKTAAFLLKKCSYCKMPSFRREEDPNCPYCRYVEDGGFREKTV